MQDKIQWYEEVMTQDPGSKLFLALARLYVEGAELDKAIRTLRNGLQKHPWHLEAQLLLNDLLHRMDRPEEALDIATPIWRVLTDHPVFWLSFADRLEQEGRLTPALAVRMLGLHFSGVTPDLNTLCAQGLQAMLQQVKSSKPLQASLDRSGTQKRAPASGPVLEEESPGEPDLEAEQAYRESLEPDSAPEPREPPPASQAPGSSPESEAYQTKTMAEILTAQGDYEAARSIYEQLLAKAVSSDDRLELENRLNTIHKLQSEQEASATQEPPPAGTSNKQELINQLEQLASRLEHL
jgi:tetratricopeptide (TPR) repeat protein